MRDSRVSRAYFLLYNLLPGLIMVDECFDTDAGEFSVVGFVRVYIYISNCRSLKGERRAGRQDSPTLWHVIFGQFVHV